MMQWLRRRWAWLAVPCGAALLALWLLVGGFWSRVSYTPRDPASGWHSGFYLYVSPRARAQGAAGEKVVILVQPNNSGINSDDPEVHRRDAWWTTYGRHGVADELGVVLLVPAFPRPATDWRIYTHALDRDTLTTEREELARLDLQLLAMLDAARRQLARSGIETEERVLIQGFSASGMFANRFTVLHPERVLAAAVGAPGGWPIAPVEEHEGASLRYPAGVADLKELTGSPFDLPAYLAVPHLIYMGAEDDNDSLDFQDGWEKEEAEDLQRRLGETPLARWKYAQDLHRAAGAPAQFVLVERVGHDRRALQHLATDFFADILKRRAAPAVVNVQ